MEYAAAAPNSSFGRPLAQHVLAGPIHVNFVTSSAGRYICGQGQRNEQKPYIHNVSHSYEQVKLQDDEPAALHF